MTAPWINAIDDSPAFVIDIDAIEARARHLAQLSAETGCRVLYSIKALPLIQVMRRLKPYVQGFSVSSLFEARLAAEILAGQGEVHLTSPGLIAGQAQELAKVCTHITANSRYQLSWLNAVTGCAIGVRLNPKLSIIDDDRYNPCRPASKLGFAAQDLSDRPIIGLHLHNAHGLSDYRWLAATVAAAKAQLGPRWQTLRWLNLGGGYLWDENTDLSEAKRLLGELCHDLPAVYIEPGLGLVGSAGYLLATVIDRWSSDGRMLAVLDTSVNHLPEVFEYQKSPALEYPEPCGDRRVQLVGGTCLAGDVFGDYGFASIPEIGDRVVFARVGAYSLVKAHRFNGHPLPAIYSWRQGRLDCLKQDSYALFRQQWL